MTKSIKVSILISAMTLSSIALAAEQKEVKDPLSEYQVDLEPATVSAGGIVGLANTAITTVQTAKDIAVFWNPMSSKENKDGRGISLNLHRLNVLRMSAQDYVGNKSFNRLLANLTFSYAENPGEISSVKYKKEAYSVETYVYLSDKQDPVDRWFRAYHKCPAKEAAENAYDKYTAETTVPEEIQLKSLGNKITEAADTCIKAAKSEANWNDSRFAISYGQGHIWKDGMSSPKYQIGKRLIATLLWSTGDDAGVYLTYQRIKNAVDTTTLATTPKSDSNNLVAARFIKGTGEAKLRYLAEISNAKSDKAGVQGAVYKAAVGIDKLVAPGVWAQLRYGRSTIASSEGTDKKALLNFTFAYACMLNNCKKTDK